MRLKKGVSEIRSEILKLGIDNTTGDYGLKAVILLVIVVIMVINSALHLWINWQDINIRVDVFRGLFEHTVILSAFSSIVFTWYNIDSLLTIVENRFYKFPFVETTQRSGLQSRIEYELNYVHWIWYYGRYVYIVFDMLPPIIILFYRLATTNIHEITTDMLITSHPYYYPRKKSLIDYSIVLFLQSSVYLCINTVYLTFSAAFIPMYILAGELKLMALSVEEMDIVIEDHALKNNGVHKTSMKLYMDYLVNHHQFIHSTAKRVNKGLELFAFFYNAGCAMGVVTSIYAMTKKDDTIGKFQEAVFGFFTMLSSFFYNIVGQEVINQDEQLRKTLYNGQWIDKPQWFKKSLQIMMIRNTKPIEIKLMGMSVLNLQTFLQFLKAIYSFYNILINFNEN